MSVYTVYTKTLHVPVYVLYQCQACKKLVVDKGSYDVSSSFSDEGTWTKKGVAKREQACDDRLLSEAIEAMSELQDSVVPITSEFHRINCKCPYCHHSSLSKYDKDDIKHMKNRLTLIVAAVVFLALIILSIIGGGLDIGVGGVILATIVATGILSIFGEGIIDLYNTFLMLNAYNKINPMISANKKLLKEKASASVAYRDIDFSNIQDSPDILEMNNKSDT